jgi:hypothetical protein
MAVNYTNLFAGIGEHVQRVNDFKALYAALDTDLSEISADMNTIGRLDIYSGTPEMFNQFKSNVLGWIGSIKTKVDALLTQRETILEELPVGNSTDIQTVLRLLIADMVAESETVEISTVTIGSPTVDAQNSDVGTVILGKTMDRVNAPWRGARANPAYKGVDSELAVASETMRFICERDSEQGGVNEGAEVWSWLGEPAVSNPYHWQNRGSGQGPTMRTLGSYSFFSNLGMETFASNLPSGFEISGSAVAGTHIDDETGGSNIWGGTTSLKLLGNASLASIELVQDVRGRLEPGRMYVLAAYVKGNGSLSAGTLKISLKGTGYSEGSTEKIEMNQAALAAQTSFGLEYCFITIPDDAPSDFQLMIRLNGTPSAHAIYIDSLAFGPVVWHGGVHASIVAGKNKFLKGDSISVAVSNDEAGVLQTFFGKAYGVQLPSDASPSIADTVAT